jgi:ABC-type transport system involved in cytochrome bd biosynthesis fused ATPase/permease subunit
MDVLTPGALSALILEGIKWLIRKIKKNPDYDFHPNFYRVLIPLLNAVMPFALLALGFPVVDPILAMTWVEILRYLIIVALGSIVSVVTNNSAIKPFKQYTTYLSNRH